MSKNQFTGTATQPQRNRKFCQFNNDQYCTMWFTGLSELVGNVWEIKVSLSSVKQEFSME